jgi:hypothetical protein
MVLAAIPGRKAEAEAAFAGAIDKCQGGAALAYVAAYLQLLGPGYRDKAEQAARDVRARSPHLIPRAPDGWYHDLLAFHAGSLDAEGLLRKAGSSRYNRCEAYFYLGLRALADGDRAAAKAWFERVLGTGQYYFTESVWGRAFLACVDDPAWLPWVPAAK